MYLAGKLSQPSPVQTRSARKKKADMNSTIGTPVRKSVTPKANTGKNLDLATPETKGANTVTNGKKSNGGKFENGMDSNDIGSDENLGQNIDSDDVLSDEEVLGTLFSTASSHLQANILINSRTSSHR